MRNICVNDPLCDAMLYFQSQITLPGALVAVALIAAVAWVLR